MTKKEFVELFASKANLKTKVEAQKLTKIFLETLEEVFIKEENVTFIGFGKFETIERAERTYINPQTKKPMKVGVRKVAKFKPAKNLLEKMNPIVEVRSSKRKKKTK